MELVTTLPEFRIYTLVLCLRHPERLTESMLIRLAEWVPTVEE
jgi:hypothetical protein